MAEVEGFDAPRPNFPCRTRGVVPRGSPVSRLISTLISTYQRGWTNGRWKYPLPQHQIRPESSDVAERRNQLPLRSEASATTTLADQRFRTCEKTTAKMTNAMISTNAMIPAGCAVLIVHPPPRGRGTHTRLSSRL